MLIPILLQLLLIIVVFKCCPNCREEFQKEGKQIGMVIIITAFGNETMDLSTDDAGTTDYP